MLAIRPVLYVIGLLLMGFAAAMLGPMLADLIEQDADWRSFALSAVITLLVAIALIFSGWSGRAPGLSVRQTFILTVATWVVLPVFGALPFLFGLPGISFTDAFFESMSGITTTGSTVLSGLDIMPAGLLLWRGLLQWIGGVGIIVMAVAILPNLQIGGMQLFKAETFDTFGKILPRAAQIASRIGGIYLGLTLICMMVYSALGMEEFDALVHAMTTIATGGYANYDVSFGAYDSLPAIEYAAVLFMLLASLPFIRYVQLLGGTAQPLLNDPQLRTFFGIALITVGALTLYMYEGPLGGDERTFRKALFNGVSILTGTGYASDDYGLWGGFPVMLFLIIGLIGGCSGSTCCSAKVFRYQVLATSTHAQIMRIRSPHIVRKPTYAGIPLDEAVISSVMAFFFAFFFTIGVLTFLLNLIGLDFVTSLSGAATAVANVGPGLGSTIGPSGNFSSLPDAAKWLLMVGMLLGRLELLSVLVLFFPVFWRR